MKIETMNQNAAILSKNAVSANIKHSRHFH